MAVIDNTQEENVHSVSVSFKFDAPADLLTTNRTAVEEAVTVWLTTSMNISSSRITNLVLSAGMSLITVLILGRIVHGMTSAVRTIYT